MRLQNELGKKGEGMAAKWLSEHGYRIIERNYRFGKAEIDILAAKGGILAVVEVKVRRVGQLQPMHLAVDRRQRERIIRAADHYVVKHGLEEEVRFDIIHIVHHQDRYSLEHLKGAFSPY